MEWFFEKIFQAIFSSGLLEKKFDDIEGKTLLNFPNLSAQILKKC